MLFLWRFPCPSAPDALAHGSTANTARYGPAPHRGGCTRDRHRLRRLCPRPRAVLALHHTIVASDAAHDPGFTLKRRLRSLPVMLQGRKTKKGELFMQASLSKPCDDLSCLRFAEFFRAWAHSVRLTLGSHVRLLLRTPSPAG